MGLWLKLGNIVLFVLAVLLGVFVFPHRKITQEVLELFPQTADREIIEVYREFASSRYVLVASEGFRPKLTRESQGIFSAHRGFAQCRHDFYPHANPAGIGGFYR